MNEIELGTKSWHLNTTIKKLLLNRINAIYYMDANIITKMHAPDSDSVLGDTFVYQSGKGRVTNHKLNLDEDT